MPEGHSLRRLAMAFDRWFVGSRCLTSSPQGRFEEGAARLDGMTMTEAQSVGKHLFLRFEPSRQGVSSGAPVWLHVHLGLYGSWRFYGDPTLGLPASIGAPRVPDSTPDLLDRAGVGDGRVAATLTNGGESPTIASAIPSREEDERGPSEGTTGGGAGGDRGGDAFRVIITPGGEDSTSGDMAEGGWVPPQPRGAVRLRIRTDQAAADLTGPTQCEVIDAAGVEAVLERLGPDPLDEQTDARMLREAFVQKARASRRPIGELMMDQSVAAGVGNIYRAEALFRQGISPHRRGANVSVARLRRLWEDLVVLLAEGVTEGHIRTVDPERVNDAVPALDEEAEKWFVYKRAGRPCLVCGTTVRTQEMQGRNLFWCSTCQR